MTLKCRKKVMENEDEIVKLKYEKYHRITKIVIAIIFFIVGVMSSNCFHGIDFSSCYEEDLYMHLKFYDKDWVEFKRYVDGKGRVYELDYNGQAQGLNVVLYIGEKVFSRRTIDRKNGFNESLLEILYYKENTIPPETYWDPAIGDYVLCSSTLIEKGTYEIVVDFNLFGMDSQYTTEDGELTLTSLEIKQMGMRTSYTSVLIEIK